MKCIFSTLFSLSSFSPCVLLFIIKNKILLFSQWHEMINYGITALICFILFLVLFTILTRCSPASDTMKIKSISPIDFNIIPMYLGLFIISLNLENTFGSYLILFLVFVLFFMIERNRNFNLFFLFIGYRFYQIESEGNISLFYISKEKDTKKKLEIDGLIRINNFTYLNQAKLNS